MLASSLAREIAEASSERAKLSAELGRLLQDDKTYRCLLTILGIGPKSASALATSLFLRDSKLAAYCGLAPADHDSGSSIRREGMPIKATRPSRTSSYSAVTRLWGRRSASRSTTTLGSARGMRYSKALKALARKRLCVIYAMMCDRVPYVEPLAGDVEKSPATT